MNRNWINALAVAAVVAVGGTAVAQQQQAQDKDMQHQQYQGQTQQQQMKVKSVSLKSLSQQDLKQLQTHLKDMGFFKGSVDGNLNQDTKNALTSYFQNQVTLSNQGRISDGALTGFGFDKSEIDRVRGIDQSQKDNMKENTQGNQNMNQQQQQEPQQQEKQY